MKEKILTGDLMESHLGLLTKVRADENWNIFFIDSFSKEKWVKEYPSGEYHGGGKPQLRLLDHFPWEEQ